MRINPAVLLLLSATVTSSSSTITAPAFAFVPFARNVADGISPTRTRIVITKRFFIQEEGKLLVENEEKQNHEHNLVSSTVQKKIIQAKEEDLAEESSSKVLVDDDNIKESNTASDTNSIPQNTQKEDVITVQVEADNILTAERRQRLQEASSLARLTKPRAYPLFLAEKTAEIVEGFICDKMKPIRKSDTALQTSSIKKRQYNDNKEKIVILGTGWGATSFLKEIDTSLYDVTVISPRNYFVFTPMLASASVGTVEYRSITEPIREVNRNVEYLEGKALEIDPVAKKVIFEPVHCDANSCCDINEEDFEVEYDRLIVTVGAQTNTFGIPGVHEYCNFLKQIEDARRIRTAIVNCFEHANMPGLTDEERISSLTFAVIGAGPAGIEFAAELRDFVEQDGPKYYPKLLKYVRIKVIEATSTVLAPFDKSLQQEAIAVMNRRVQIQDPQVRNLLPEQFQLTELLLDSSVKEVTEKFIILNNDAKMIQYGLAVWVAGNGPLPLTMNIIERLGEEQTKYQKIARGRIAVDPWLRASGSHGTILAFGDCSCNPTTTQFLPATAQVAAQQGEYLAALFNKQFDLSSSTQSSPGGLAVLLPPTRNPEIPVTLSDKIANFATKNDQGYAKPFQFLNMGILAYIGGGSALAQANTVPGVSPIKSSGKIGNALWRSVYFTKQVSWRNRILVLNDWFKKELFGRDITRL